MSYRKMKTMVGLFMLVLLAVGAASIWFLLETKGAFDKKHRFFFQTESAESFYIGMPLKFSGFEVGVIEDIHLNQDGTVKMDFWVREQHVKWVNRDTFLVLKRPLIGSPHIEVHTQAKQDALKANSQIKIIISDDINDMISKLEPAVGTLVNIINSADQITALALNEEDGLQKILSNLEKVLSNIEQFSSSIAQSESLLTTLTGDESSTENISNILNNMERFSGNISQEGSLLSIITGDRNSTQQLIAALNETAGIMQNLSGLTRGANSSLVQPSTKAIEQVNQLLAHVRRQLISLDPMIKTIANSDQDLLEIKKQVSVGLEKSNEIIDAVDSLLLGGDRQLELP